MSRASSEAPLMVSVSGVRGIVGGSLGPVDACRYGWLLGDWLRGRAGVGLSDRPGDRAVVVVGRDSRGSGPMLESAAVAGLQSAGVAVVRLGVVSTPTVAYMVRRLGAAGGLVVTASHNPRPWNGLKPLRSDGSAPPMAEAQELVERFTGGGATPAGAAVEHVGQVTARDDAAVLHAEAVAGLVDVEAIRGAKLNVVVDSVSGAGGDGARALLERLGVGLTHLYPWPTGRFPHPPEPTEENLRGLCEAVRTYRADLGMAQDTDADRLALVDAEGRYIGEEYTLVLCAMARLAGGQVERATMAANLSTSRMLDDLAREHGGRVVRTPVGEAHVAAAIRDRDALLGGEGNGGIIDPRVSYVRDSLVGMALVLELMATQRATLAELVDRLPRYAMVKDKMPADDAVKAALPDLPERVFRGRPVDRRDGVRVDWEDRWVQVRASNTEPIVRVMAEAPDQAGARELVRRVWEALDT